MRAEIDWRGIKEVPNTDEPILLALANGEMCLAPASAAYRPRPREVGEGFDPGFLPTHWAYRPAHPRELGRADA